MLHNSSDSYPTQRSYWATLDWSDAQSEVARMLNYANFMKFEEKNLGNHKRADVVVIKRSSSKVVFGIIEVKCYKKITPGIEKNAMQQACNYLQLLHNMVKDNNRWNSKPNNFFAATVFTKDYPNRPGNHNPSMYHEILPKQLVKNGLVSLISCVPEMILGELYNRGLLSKEQSSLKNYFPQLIPDSQ